MFRINIYWHWQFCFATCIDDICKDFGESKDDMDFSHSLPIKSKKMYDTTTKGILGKFKSEETFEITDFCGLKPKC